MTHPIQSSVRACIFDMDGLLLDTETIYTHAQQAVLEKHGRTFTWALKAQMMGMKALEAAQLLVTELQLEGQLKPEDFLTQREVIMDELFATVPLLPGAEKLLRHLASAKVPMALATSSHRRHFDLKTSQHRELFELFEVVVTGDMVERGKPFPDIFLAAANQLHSKPTPSQCLVFEDAPSGVAAALAAGMLCVMVPDANLSPCLFQGAGQVISSLVDFAPEQWGLPPFSLDASA